MENDMTESRTMIAGIFSPGKPDVIVMDDGSQYAKLPEAWPAAEDKDLEEAHAEAVASDEPDAMLAEWERKLYAWTPVEVKELIMEYMATAEELRALRKGMKTMQRKTRKHTQVQRRLERRLAQARSGREQLRAEKDKADRRRIADMVQSLAELGRGEGVTVRGGE